jgi:hypothetical protein
MDEGAVAEATFPDRTFTAPDGTKIFVGDLKPEQKKRRWSTDRKSPRVRPVLYRP